jgi:hypothetical protein
MSFLSRLKQIRAGAFFVAATAAAVSKIVIRDEMVPRQLTWLADGGVLVSMLALIIVQSVRYRQRSGLMTTLEVLAAISLITIIMSRATLFEEVNLGEKNYQVLVGTSLSNMGEEMQRNCMRATRITGISSLSRHELIRCAGVDSIPSLYGYTFMMTEIVYSLSYLLFLGLFVVLVGAQSVKGEEKNAPISVE